MRSLFCSRGGFRLSALAGFFLPACMVGDSHMAGSVQKGPFLIGSSVLVQELDDAYFVGTGREFTASTTDDFGSFEVGSVQTSHAEVVATGFYFDEISG